MCEEKPVGAAGVQRCGFETMLWVVGDGRVVVRWDVAVQKSHLAPKASCVDADGLTLDLNLKNDFSPLTLP